MIPKRPSGTRNMVYFSIVFQLMIPMLKYLFFYFIVVSNIKPNFNIIPLVLLIKKFKISVIIFHKTTLFLVAASKYFFVNFSVKNLALNNESVYNSSQVCLCR